MAKISIVFGIGLVLVLTMCLIERIQAENVDWHSELDNSEQQNGDSEQAAAKELFLVDENGNELDMSQLAGLRSMAKRPSWAGKRDVQYYYRRPGLYSMSNALSKHRKYLMKGRLGLSNGIPRPYKHI
jgi:hypothetical protein